MRAPTARLGIRSWLQCVAVGSLTPSRQTTDSWAGSATPTASARACTAAASSAASTSTAVAPSARQRAGPWSRPSRVMSYQRGVAPREERASV
ncbi:hypothetical protein DT076_10720 [Desertihabitans brevis]|uniref:Uncharacterized protein n=1 Tax=Desertihabitans brevis TaxID=2268447 RepID=A0A367YU90_9ACTN|nr:hypothetical protein DT076_10720 [Desertihabitans brevis]